MRYVRTPDGMLAEGRTLNGRGAWVCQKSATCVEAAVRRRAFARALRGDIRSEAIEWLRESSAGRDTGASRDSRDNRVSMDGYENRRKG